MKLSTKFLTALTPIAAAGIIVPATVSCSCGNNDYVINYGDNINCKDEGADGYKKLEDVQKAIKNRANKESGKGLTSDVINSIKECSTIEKAQMIYYDLIASYTILEGDKISLTGWKHSEGDIYSFEFNLVTAGGTYNNNGLHIYYDHAEDVTNSEIDIFVAKDTNVILKHKSYQFSDCWYIKGE